MDKLKLLVMFVHKKAKMKLFWHPKNPLWILMILLSSAAFAQQPTLMSLQGKLINSTTGAKILSADLRVNINDSSGIVFNQNYSNAVSNGIFDLVLGSAYSLNLSFNEQYNLTLFVNNVSQLGEPYLFRGGQGQVGAGDIATTESYIFSNVSVIGNISVGGNLSVDTNVFFVDAENDRVGIGTTLPAEKLVVIGKVNISDSLNVSGTVQATTFVGDGSLLSGINTDFTNNTDINVTNFVANNTLFVNGSRVGIGTTAPTSSLHVVGDANITGNISFSDGTKQESAPSLPKDYIAGLVLSNNTEDGLNDTVISAGEARDSTDTEDLVLSTDITKRIDASFAAGDGAGGMFSGSVANKIWYHVFIIKKDSDGTIDAGFDTSETAANIPAGYTKYKRVGSVLTDGSANIFSIKQEYISPNDPGTPTLLAVSQNSWGTVVVGHDGDLVNATGLSPGSAINAAIGDVADITNPSSWTTLVNITGEKDLILRDNTGSFVYFIVHYSETSGKWLRGRITIDGKVVADAYTTCNPASNHGIFRIFNNARDRIHINSSFTVEAARQGEFAQASGFYIGAIEEITLS